MTTRAGGLDSHAARSLFCRIPKPRSWSRTAQDMYGLPLNNQAITANHGTYPGSNYYFYSWCKILVQEKFSQLSEVLLVLSQKNTKIRIGIKIIIAPNNNTAAPGPRFKTESILCCNHPRRTGSAGSPWWSKLKILKLNIMTSLGTSFFDIFQTVFVHLL